MCVYIYIYICISCATSVNAAASVPAYALLLLRIWCELRPIRAARSRASKSPGSGSSGAYPFAQGDTRRSDVSDFRDKRTFLRKAGISLARTRLTSSAPASLRDLSGPPALPARKKTTK